MNNKNLSQAVMNRNLSAQERMFRLFSVTGLFCFIIQIIGRFIADTNTTNLIFSVIMLLLIFAIVYISIKSHKVNEGVIIIASVMTYVLLPINFLTSGGIYGGGSFWFLLGIVYVCLNVYGKLKYFFLGSNAVIYICCLLFAYFCPDIILQYAANGTVSDLVISFFVVVVLATVMILFQNEIYESENRIANEQKKEIEKLNRMQNSFFSTMSHEIRTPINTIIGLNELILREDISDEVARNAENIQGASKMLLTLINDILDMSKIESGNMEIVPAEYDLASSLSDIVNMIWVRAKEKGLEFHINVDEKIPSRLYGDEVRLKQVLINILNNAVKYTAEGSVTLSIQCEDAAPGFVNMIYSITDTGMGIKKESMPYLFSAFKRVDEEKNKHIEGTGLGLSISKQLIDLMGGTIKVNSIYTKGSTFVVTVPQGVVLQTEIGKIDLEERHNLNQREYYRHVFEAPNANVLIVDDNEMNLMVAEKLLRDTRVNVRTARSGEEALKETAHTRYDVIFMDHLMPEMDGIECLHEIRKQKQELNVDTPIVALTANAGEESRLLYEREGFDGYLLKPVSGEKLEAELLRNLPPELVNITKPEEEINSEMPKFERRKKYPIIISTDSICDLPADMLEKNQIAVMPCCVHTEEGDFVEGIEIETDGLMAYIEKEGKTAYSDVSDVSGYEDFFAEHLTKAQHIIHISTSKYASSGYRNACAAAETFDNVSVVDSGHLSSGLGLIVLEAARYAEEISTNPDEIVSFIKGMRKKVSTTFMVEETKYLTYSGRLSPGLNKICNTLMIYPTLGMKKSKIKVAGILIGQKERRWKSYIRHTLRHLNDIDKKIVFITYVGLSHDDLEDIKQQVLARVPFEQVIYYQAASAIAINCGPGTFGLIFMKKQRVDNNI